jgi:hypothetical protein
LDNALLLPPKMPVAKLNANGLLEKNSSQRKLSVFQELFQITPQTSLNAPPIREKNQLALIQLANGIRENQQPPPAHSPQLPMFHKLPAKQELQSGTPKTASTLAQQHAQLQLMPVLSNVLLKLSGTTKIASGHASQNGIASPKTPPPSPPPTNAPPSVIKLPALTSKTNALGLLRLKLLQQQIQPNKDSANG